MAKGKVRCGQCFHIFEAQSHANPKIDTNNQQKSKPTPAAPKAKSNKVDTGNPAKETKPADGHSPNLFTSADEDDIVNPDWLNTLISDDDLAPVDKKNQEANLNPHARQALSHQDDVPPKTKVNASILKEKDEPAPWEVELAELEAAQNKNKTTPQKTTPTKKQEPHLSLMDDDFFLDSETLAQPQSAKPQRRTKSTTPAPAPQPEPEYMQALQELAQSVSQTSANKGAQGLEFNHDVSHNLGELMDDPNDNLETKPKHTWRWALACFIFIVIGGIQFLVVNYESGSRSASFRPIYNIVCSYYGCELPVFEDVKAIDIQHVRVQSHATKENALVVNAIMTNHSNFSQPMPKIAMEFYDLNGNPVAARLFSQKDFLDKDFLDITYMPPKTPIHLVIAIADPGASAVTHKLKVYRAETRSY